MFEDEIYIPFVCATCFNINFRVKLETTMIWYLFLLVHATCFNYYCELKQKLTGMWSSPFHIYDDFNISFYHFIFFFQKKFEFRCGYLHVSCIICAQNCILQYLILEWSKCIKTWQKRHIWIWFHLNVCVCVYFRFELVFSPWTSHELCTTLCFQYRPTYESKLYFSK